MEIKEWIALITALIIIVGWFVNSILNRQHQIANAKLNRQHEIAKERFKYQMIARQSCLDMFFLVQKNKNVAPFTNPEFMPLLEKARTNFLLYCTDVEINLLEEFISILTTSPNTQEKTEKLFETLPKLSHLMQTKIRSELRISQ